MGGEDGEVQHRRYQVLTIRDGLIIDIQGCRTRRAAKRYSRH